MLNPPVDTIRYNRGIEVLFNIVKDAEDTLVLKECKKFFTSAKVFIEDESGNHCAESSLDDKLSAPLMVDSSCKGDLLLTCQVSWNQDKMSVTGAPEAPPIVLKPLRLKIIKDSIPRNTALIPKPPGPSNPQDTTLLDIHVDVEDAAHIGIGNVYMAKPESVVVIQVKILKDGKELTDCTGSAGIGILLSIR